MTISDDDAKAAWKKAQGQVSSRTDLKHVIPVLVLAAVVFTGVFLLARFQFHVEWGEALLSAVIVTLLAILRFVLRSMRNRRP